MNLHTEIAWGEYYRVWQHPNFTSDLIMPLTEAMVEDALADYFETAKLTFALAGICDYYTDLYVSAKNQLHLLDPPAADDPATLMGRLVCTQQKIDARIAGITPAAQGSWQKADLLAMSVCNKCEPSLMNHPQVHKFSPSYVYEPLHDEYKAYLTGAIQTHLTSQLGKLDPFESWNIGHATIDFTAQKIKELMPRPLVQGPYMHNGFTKIQTEQLMFLQQTGHDPQTRYGSRFIRQWAEFAHQTALMESLGEIEYRKGANPGFVRRCYDLMITEHIADLYHQRRIFKSPLTVLLETN